MQTSLAPATKPDICCPRFQPEGWRGRILTWNDKPFVKAHVRSAFHIPLGVRRMFTQQSQLIDHARAATGEPFVLTDERSALGADYYFPVSVPIAGSNIVTLAGEFATDVFEGPYRELGKWFCAARERIEATGRKVDRQYVWYTTCPKCAKKYGENYAVVFTRLA